MSDAVAGVLGMLLVLSLILGLAIVAIRQHNVQAAKWYLCLGCETVSAKHFAKRAFWPWFIVGPFALLWPKKMTCQTCNSHDLVPAESPRARKVLAAAVGK
jgi:hypothetical protein